MYFGRFSSHVLARSAGILSQKSYWPHQWCVMPMKMSGAALAHEGGKILGFIALIRDRDDLHLVAGFLAEVLAAGLVELVELGVLLPVRPEHELLGLDPARRRRQRHRYHGRDRDRSHSTHAPAPFS